MRSALLVVCLVATSVVTPAAGQLNLDFTLLNRTGFTVVQLFVSPDDSEEWGEDVLGADVLPDGASVDLTFSRAETNCLWDLKIVDEDADEVEWDRLNLCQASHITIRYENGRPTATVK